MCKKYDVPFYKVIIYIISDTPNDDCNIHIETTDVVTAGAAAAPSTYQPRDAVTPSLRVHGIRQPPARGWCFFCLSLAVCN